MEKLGIEQIKKVLKATFKIITKIEEAKESDNKVTLMEAGGIVMTSVPDAYNAVRNGRVLFEELKDLDDEERMELQTWFATEFDLADDVAEEKIEAIFNWLVVTSDTIMTVIG